MTSPTKLKNIELSMKSNQREELLEELEATVSSENSNTKSKKKLKRYNSIKVDENEQKYAAQIEPEIKKQQKNFSWPIWQKLFKYLMRRKLFAGLGLFLSLCYAFSISLLPLKVGKVLDYITTTKQDQNIKNMIDLSNSIMELGIMIAMLAVFTFLRFVSIQFLQEFIAIDMKTDFFSKFIKNDMYFFEQYKSGQLVSRLSSDINQAKAAVSDNLTFLIRNVVIIISNIIILFTISWKLTLLVMLLVPLYALITLQYTKKNKFLIKKHTDIMAENSAFVAQKFSGIQLVKAYTTEDEQIRKYGELLVKAYEINKKRILIQAIYTSCSDFLPYCGILIVLWYGGQMVIAGSSELTAGELTSFIMYCSSLATSTSFISHAYTNIVNGTFAVQKVFDMLSYSPQVDENVGQQHQITGNIQLSHVRFQYPTSEACVLKNVSLKIQKGEYIAFVGESGSGKSTIIKLIQKFYKIQEGDLYFDSHNAKDIKVNCLRRQIGLVNQDATMFSGSIQHNITYGLHDYDYQQLEDAAQKSGCLQFLKNQDTFPNGFRTEVGEKGSHLSGGQKQRISIARAILRKPKIIIFDEATSALDANSESMVQSSIQRLAHGDKEDKPTIIVIAHRLSTVMNADRIYVMKNGEIVESGSHKQLLDMRGYYYQLIEKQLHESPERIYSKNSSQN